VALFAYFQRAGLSSIDGNASFEHHGCQKEDETGSKWYCRGKNPSMRHNFIYDNFTPKEKAQIQ